MGPFNYPIHVIRRMLEELSPPGYMVGLVITGIVVIGGLVVCFHLMGKRIGRPR